MHECPDCGLSHDAPGRPAEDPMVKVAKVEAERDIQVAKIQAGVSRDEMLREIEALRAELTVRQEEPPIAESVIVEAQADPEPEPEPEVIPVDAPAPEPPAEETPPPPETVPPSKSEKKKAGFWDMYR